MTRSLLTILCLMGLVGCTTSSETVQHGTVKYLFTQTQNQWAENVVLVSPCEQDLVNGQCKPAGETKVLVISGKLPGVVGGAVHDAALVGSSFVIRDGLIKSKSNVSQSNAGTSIRSSTTVVGGPIHPGVAP